MSTSDDTWEDAQIECNKGTGHCRRKDASPPVQPEAVPSDGVGDQPAPSNPSDAADGTINQSATTAVSGGKRRTKRRRRNRRRSTKRKRPSRQKRKMKRSKRRR